MLKTRFSNSLAPKALLVAVAAGGVFLLGGVANADTPPPAGSQGTGTGSPIGGLSPVGGLLTGGAGGLGLGHLVGPLLQPILGGLSGGTGGLGLGQLTGPLLGGLGS